MSPSTDGARSSFQRIAGASLMLGGLMFILIWVYWASLPTPGVDEVKPHGEPFDVANAVSSVLVLIGLTGSYFVQADRVRRLDRGEPGLRWVGFGIVMLWVGIALMTLWLTELLDSYVLFSGGAITMLAGLIAYAIGSLRAAVLPRSAIISMIVGVLLFALMDPDSWRALFAVPLGVAWLWLGCILLGDRRSERSSTIMSPPH